MLKKLGKLIKLSILLIVLGISTQVTVMNAEIKTENSNLNKTLDLNAMAQKYDEIVQADLYNPIDVYNGRLTGYAADCPLCSGRLGCNGQNVLDRTITYNDKEYGDVRIVASSSLLPCGSIVEFQLSNIFDKPIIAIVLDRGVGGTSIDLLVESEEYAIKNIGSKNITYNVLRLGYQR